MVRFHNLIKKAANNLSRSGAVLFVINPSGVHYNSADVQFTESDSDRIGSDGLLSGEGSLSLLASESGGKYLEGTSKNITAKIHSMQQGFYFF